MRANGIDISIWNGKMNFAKTVLAGAEFIFVKSSQQVMDVNFKTNWQGAKDAGLLRGAYHYLDFRKSTLDQAKLFVDLLHNDPGELPPVLDLEMNPMPYGFNAIGVSGKAWEFLTYVEKELNRIPMIYSGYYYWNSWGSNNIGWTHFPFWLAWYAPEFWIRVPKPWTKWTFWQWTDKGGGPTYGSTGLNLDRNWFNGTTAELKKFAIGTTIVIPPVPVTGQYEVITVTSKVFAGPVDTYRQVAKPLPRGTHVTVLRVVTNTEKWAELESPTGWTRLANIAQS